MQENQENKIVRWTERPELKLEKNSDDDYIDINGEPIAFFGNPDLLPPKAKLKYTLPMIEEILKCKEDILYFAENYYKAQTPSGFNFIKLYDYQKTVIKDMTDTQKYVLMMPRQMGKCQTKETLLSLNKNDNEYEQTVEDLFNECKKEFNETSN